MKGEGESRVSYRVKYGEQKTRKEGVGEKLKRMAKGAGVAWGGCRFSSFNELLYITTTKFQGQRLTRYVLQ